MTDIDIINKILQGESDKYSLLMEQYHNEIFSFAYQLTGNYETTEDLVQEIFLKVYKKLTKYNPKKASFRTWLYRISKNLILNYLNSKDYKSHNNLKEYDDYMSESNNNIEEETIKEEKVNQIIKVIKTKLKPKYQEIIVLHYFGNLTVKEISETLQINEKTIYYAIQTSIKKIREEVQE